MAREPIFQFGVFQREGARPKAALITAALTVSLLLSAELITRSALSSVSHLARYWEFDAATKFERYRELVAANQTPRVLIVGDSTGAHGINPAYIPGAYNLAWPSNFPKALSCTTTPLLSGRGPVPQVVIVSLSPYGFREHPNTSRLEANLLTSPYCRALRGEFVLSDYLALARLSHIAPLMFYQPRQMTPLGFLPMSEKKAAAAAPAQPGRSPTQNKNNEDKLNESRFEIITELAELAKERGFRLVVVIPPRADHEITKNYPLFQSYLQRLQELSSQGALQLLDLEEATFLRKEHFRDPGHVTEEGAVLLSKEIQRMISQ
jgi:hypothetical protein